MFTACEDNPQKADDGKFEGRTEWAADQFSPLPESAPFELDLQLQKRTSNGKEILDMEFVIHNPTSDSVFITTSAFDGPHYNFIVTTPDSIRIWSRLSNVRGAAEVEITLEPGETQRYEHSWNYTNYSGDYIEKGQYLVYATIDPLTTEDSSFENELKEFDKPIVGPDTIEVNLQQ